jgi:hypothetical protein
MDLSRSVIEGMIRNPLVFGRNNRDSEEMFVDYHFLTNTCAEFLHLLPYILKEGIA